MKFSKDYSKLDKDVFTTVRKNTKFYTLGNVYKIETPFTAFFAQLERVRFIKKKDITEDIAQSDADCSKAELIAMLEKWYGKEFDDFVLLTLKKEHHK